MIGNPDKMSLCIALCKRRRVMRSKPGFRIVLFERPCGADCPRSRIYFASHCPNEDSELIWWTGNRMALCKRRRVMGSRPGFRIVLFERRCGTDRPRSRIYFASPCPDCQVSSPEGGDTLRDPDFASSSSRDDG